MDINPPNGNNDDNINIWATFNHEEIGSNSNHGAASTFLKDVIDDILTDLGLAASRTQILNNTDIDSLRERATPRATKTLSKAQVNRIKALSATHTLSQIADKLNISSTTVSKYLKGVN